MSRPTRIFIGLTEVAGYFAGLREGFETLGLDVIQINEAADPYGYGRAANRFSVGNLATRLHELEAGAGASRQAIARATRFAVRASRLPPRVIMLAEALRSCDVFVFGGSSFVAGHDLRVIRRAGKRIVWVFTGTDHRPPYLNGKVVRQMLQDPKRLVSEASVMRKHVQRVESYAHAVVAHGPSAQFHRRPFAEFLSVGIPVRAVSTTDPVSAAGPWPGPPGVRILHSPTDPAKGSGAIRSIVERLQARGLPISYVEMVGRPNAEVRARLEQADIVVDEVFSDSPMGVFAAEAASSGVPTIVGGYWADQIKSELPASVIPPSVFVLPSDLEDNIKRLVIDKDQRQVIGRQASQHVHSEWRPEAVAQRVLALAYGDYGDLTVSEPAHLTYCAGWGMSMEFVQTTIRHLVSSWGVGSLAMSHNPSLEARMISIACENRLDAKLEITDS